MGDLKKRGLSLLLAFIMIVSLLAGVTFPAASAAGTVDYVYSGKYVYNWGSRGTDATFLSPMAEDWYEKYNVTFDELMGYSGSSNRSSVPSSALYRELQGVQPLSYPLTLHATLAYYRPGEYSPGEAACVWQTLRQLGRERREWRLRLDELHYATFDSMARYMMV